MYWREVEGRDKYVPRLHKMAMQASTRHDKASSGTVKVQGAAGVKDWVSETIVRLEQGYRATAGI